MKNTILLLIITVLSFSAFGQDKGKFEDLTVSLTVLKSEVLPIEPIAFKVIVANNSQLPITITSGLSFSTSSVGLEIKKPDGKTVVPTQLSHVRARIIFSPKDLKSGEDMESTEVFDFKTQTYFGKPGQYQVRAIYKSDGKQIYSDWINLTLTDPVGTDKAAYDFLSKKMQKTYSPFTSWNTEELEEFLLNFAGSGYANHVHYRLGERYFEKEKDKSEEQFRAISDGTFVYADQVSERLKKLESQKKNDR